MENSYYFEGPEKNLEVWFRPAHDVAVPSNSRLVGLRGIPRSSWELLLQEVRCTILSEMETDFMNSFVLSESSMFVTPFRFILKTCGQTTLLYALPKLLELASSVGLTCVEELFFSRHHLGRPDLQLFPHTSFADEVKFLDTHFGGSAFSLGKINDSDTCYLYTLDSEEGGVDVADQTLEILMSELDQDAMKSFYKSDTLQNFEQASKISGISSIFPSAILDGFLFEPCGYSVNGMMGPYFFTIHITPQDGFSFASFETDMPMENYDALVAQVLDIFKPGRATITVMANFASGLTPSAPSAPSGYYLRDVQRQELSRYHIVYSRVRKGTAESSRRASTAAMVPMFVPQISV